MKSRKLRTVLIVIAAIIFAYAVVLIQVLVLRKGHGRRQRGRDKQNAAR